MTVGQRNPARKQISIDVRSSGGVLSLTLAAAHQYSLLHCEASSPQSAYDSVPAPPSCARDQIATPLPQITLVTFSIVVRRVKHLFDDLYELGCPDGR